MGSISADKLATEVMKTLKEYGSEVSTTVAGIAEAVGDETAKQLRRTSPRRKKGGRYARGWTVEKRRNRLGSFTVTVYNKNKPQLTHLLENGHLNRDGSKTPAHPHVKTAEDAAISALERKIKVLNK